MLRWTQEHLADVSGVSKPIISMENDKLKLVRRAFEDVRMAIERAGVEFPEDEAPKIKS